MTINTAEILPDCDRALELASRYGDGIDETISRAIAYRRFLVGENVVPTDRHSGESPDASLDSV